MHRTDQVRPMLPSDQPPAQHFNYDELDDYCRCSLCEGVRAARAAYDASRANRPKHNRLCKCEGCTAPRAAFTRQLAAANKRDLYCEVSYLMTGGPEPHRLARHCMGWLYERITQAPESTRWWAISADRIPLRKWLDDFTAEYNTTYGVSGRI